MRITTKDVQLLRDLRIKRASLEKREDELRKRLTEGLREAGGSITRGIWTCSLVEYAGQPSWKAEYLKVAGEEAAKRLAETAPKHDRITIAAK
jgi:hypothetical protein